MQRLKFVLAGLLITTPAFAQGDGTGSGDGTTTGDGTGGGETTPAPTGGEAMPAPMGGDAAAPMKKMTVGADLAFVLPLGDYADGASAAIGALGRFEFAVNEQLAITGRIGFIYNLLKNVPDGVSASLIFIPVMAGAAYKIGTSGLFAYGEVGLTNIRSSAEAGGMEFSDSTTKLSIGAGAGYQMNK